MNSSIRLHVPPPTVRVLNMLLGAWLFLSAFSWRHAPAAMTNTWIVGLLTVVFAIAATRFKAFRLLNAGLAIWLFVSNWVLPLASRGTFWNNAIVAIAIFCVSITEGVSERSERHGPLHA